MKKIAFLILFFSLFILHSPSQAQVSGDWSIDRFNSVIDVNQDSSLTITEEISANCPNCFDKHGIFRILPTQTKVSNNKVVQTPVKLESVTDFNNNPLPYTTSNDYLNHTITFKIGDPNVTVSGVNNYKIIYTVKNAIRFNNTKFDELYWNILGNYWKLPINNFQATINFPNAINKNNTTVSYYTGSFGSQDSSLAQFSWVKDNSIQFTSTKPLRDNQGITASITFPKNILTQPQENFLTLYGAYLWLLIPFLTLIFIFKVWKKYGRDPKLHRTTVVEFSIPDNLTPIEMGTLINNGYLRNKTITASLIDLAVKKIIKIKEIPKSGLFSNKDYELTLISEGKTPIEKLLIEKLFGKKKTVLISSLENSFYKSIPDISNLSRQELIDRKLINSKGFILTNIFLVIAIMLMIVAVLSFVMLENIFNPILLSASLGLSGLIFFVFSPLMKQRTKEGALLLEKIKGFELYIKTAEKYRQQFNEKENIFEKYLPYAMLFGLTGIWIEKMKEIYGNKYFDHYAPIWFISSNSKGFNIDNFTKEISHISTSMNSATSSSSGAGGSGFSGGGFGGGGGGGW
jgi:uncharacterized membrane protein